jgi:NADH-quinone oxidoreductase subunit N
VLGALASGMLLYGMSMVYGASGMGGTPTLDLTQLHHVMGYTKAPTLLVFGLIFMIVGIGFKLGAAPFHMWIPDVYQGAPTPVTAFIASGSKLAAFGMAFRLLDSGMGDLSHQWQLMLAVLAVASLAIGNLVAIVQTNLKRMLAYSTISHMGYLLLGLSAANAEGYAAAMFYAICYALMSVAAFGVMLAMARAGFECEEISDLKGLGKKSPWMALLMLLTLFSLAGVPPLVGFWAKALVLEAAIHAHMMWLAIVGIVFAIIGLYYYLYVIKVMYFDQPADGSVLQAKSDISLRVMLSLNALGLLALGLYWGPLLGWCRHAFGI